ncbi:hypothetical protein XM38_028240 [Halomicronema hongdechloris C2206]|uniref:Uncharacterized protein n=1 Tax=Halomicronema hongdechloris C2206 TaxID=1641165 RepID=A0A1Z3HNL4_9CYAN|nr:YihY/virulence factor BrkB family protein [Halomicronema hongdechloris]ASC71870.1 hypothetical protein XM38_028240 [Halomicronema hongdechloris C2206]
MPMRRIRRALSVRAFIRFLRCLLTPKTLREVVRRTGEQRLPSLASEMAYNAILGLFPGILALLTAIGLVASLEATLMQLASRLSDVTPVEALTVIRNFTQEVNQGNSSRLFSLSFGFSLWAASGAVSAAMRALDEIHEVPRGQSRPFWKAKLVSLGLTLGTLLLLLVACALVFVSNWLVHRVAAQGGPMISLGLLHLWRWLSWPLALAIVAAAFVLIYRFGPSRWQPGKPLVPGAVLAALAWAGLSMGFRLYGAHFGHFNRVYGAVGAVIVLLLWLYLGSLSMLMGDQLNVTVGDDLRQRAVRRGLRPQGPGLPVAPPSFESFTIRRREDGASPKRWSP